jgi:hypothetical protein
MRLATLSCSTLGISSASDRQEAPQVKSRWPLVRKMLSLIDEESQCLAR